MATYAQVAAHLFLTVRRLQVLIGEDVFPRQADGKGFDLDECRKAYVMHLRDRATGKLDKPRDSVDDGRARLLRAQASKAEREELEAGGELAHKDETLREWVSAVLNCKGKLLAIPAQVARLVPVESRQAVQLAAQNLTNEALSELAGSALPRRGPGNVGRASARALHANAEIDVGRMDAGTVPHKRGRIPGTR